MFRLVRTVKEEKKRNERKKIVETVINFGNGPMRAHNLIDSIVVLNYPMLFATR